MKRKVNSKTNLVEVEKKLYLEYVYLADNEYKKLISRYGETEANHWIERANNWIAEAPNEKKRKDKTSHYHMILNWDDMDKKKKQQNNIQSSTKKPQYKNVSDIKFD
jgi:hypothetical protein